MDEAVQAGTKVRWWDRREGHSQVNGTEASRCHTGIKKTNHYNNFHVESIEAIEVDMW